MDEITGNRGVIFATGTPVSNSMTELYTMQRYLQYERLQELNMTHFDCWASRFGETVTALELAPEGTGYRARTRFSKFFNLPELMNLFKEVADIKTADQLNLPTPEVEYHNIVAQPTEHQQEMVKALSERASEVHRGSVDPSVDNMLKITSDGRKLGLDQRIVNQMLPDEPGTKAFFLGNVRYFPYLFLGSHTLCFCGETSPISPLVDLIRYLKIIFLFLVRPFSGHCISFPP